MRRLQSLTAAVLDPDFYVGAVTEVTPTMARINLPGTKNPAVTSHFGLPLKAGQVGELIAIDCGEHVVIGRVMKVGLAIAERLSVEPWQEKEANTPTADVWLLATVDLALDRIDAGIEAYPRLGARAYSAHPELIKAIVERTATHAGVSRLRLEIAHLSEDPSVMVGLQPEILFGRHCAILGATGGGKSWTVSRIVEECCRSQCKLVLVDATGEFGTLSGVHVRSVALASEVSGSEQAEASYGDVRISLPFAELMELDLFALFSPSLQAQAPILREAIRSLKLAALSPEIAQNGIIIKENQSREPYDEAYRTHRRAIEAPGAVFSVENLCRQIEEECVHPSPFDTGRGDQRRQWGRKNPQTFGWCASLILRIEGMIASPELGFLFDPRGLTPWREEFERFIRDPIVRVLRLSLRHLTFRFRAREIALNAIGRSMLEAARAGDFLSTKPVVVVLDEAHHFLGKVVGEEDARYPLDAFSLIAKEGRKYWLTLCLATQRPRDVPDDVLSQVGTIVAHRVVNERDRDAIERASSEIDRSAAAFLPALRPGQAAIIGVDFPVPLVVQMRGPSWKPESTGPLYQQRWGVTEGASPAAEDGEAQQGSLGSENRAGEGVPS